MTRRELFPIINCSDIQATRAFYQHVFEGEQTYQFPEEGDAVYLVLRIGEGQLALGVGTGPALYGSTPRPASGHAIDICIYVSDLEGVVASAEKGGAAIPVRPQPMPWGETVAYVQDPEGTMLLVIQSEHGTES